MADWLATRQTAPFGLEVEMKQKGIWDANRRMKKISGRAKSLRPAMVKVAAFLRYELKRDWDSGGSYSGNPWPKNINDTYVAWKRRRYPSSQGRVMHLSQNLRKAMTTKAHPSHYEELNITAGQWSGVEIGIKPGTRESLVAGALKAGRIGGGVAKGGAPRGGVQLIQPRNPMQFRRAKTMQGVAIIIGQYIETGFLPPSDHM